MTEGEDISIEFIRGHYYGGVTEVLDALGGEGTMEPSHMPPLPITIVSPPQTRKSRKFIIEVDAEKFERLAANFGLFGTDFLASLERAEREVRAGRTRKISSLRELRRRPRS